MAPIELKIIVSLLILNSLLIGSSVSMQYEEIGDGEWEKVSNDNEKFNETGWITYLIQNPKIAEIKIMQEGEFQFAWKMNDLNPGNRLHFKNNLLNTTKGYEKYGAFNVKKDDKLKWVFSVVNGGRIWIAFPPAQTNSTTIKPPMPPVDIVLSTPPMPTPTVNAVLNGPAFGLTDSELKFSIICGANTNYLIDWGDGQKTEIGSFMEAKTINESHIWMENKQYIVRVLTRNSNNETIGESKEFIVDLYDHKELSNNSLQDAINNIENYTELVLRNPEYVIDEVFIKNKGHIIIRSEQGYAILSGNCAENKIIINDSSHIKLIGLHIRSANNGIIIDNSNNLNISLNIIEFGCGNTGLILKCGQNNTIIGNEIWHQIGTHERGANWGIEVDKGRDNRIENNIINHDGNYYHYVINYENQNNTIIVSDLNRFPQDHDRDTFVKLGNCSYSWNVNGFEQSCEQRPGCNCLPHDSCLVESHIWCP
jgi:hypothetical protein